MDEKEFELQDGKENYEDALEDTKDAPHMRQYVIGYYKQRDELLKTIKGKHIAFTDSVIFVGNNLDEVYSYLRKIPIDYTPYIVQVGHELPYIEI